MALDRAKSCASLADMSWDESSSINSHSSAVTEQSQAESGPSGTMQSSLTCALARFRLTASSLPLERYMIHVASDFRRALMSRVNGDSATFSGRSNGRPRRDHHQHAYWLPEPGQGGRIEHLMVYSREGFGVAELEALLGLRVVSRGARGDQFTVLLEGVDCLPGLQSRNAPGEEWISSLLGPALRWTSLTPFCPSRHPKGPDSFEKEVRLGLVQSGIATPLHSVRVLSHCHDGARFQPRPSRQHSEAGTPWSLFHRTRQGREESLRGSGFPKALEVELEFVEPVLGPILLGSQSHFGLGRFRPIQ